ncbi:multidrug efflux system subunit MdtA [Novipirellula aureliae]|uniref:Multidrug efflux system subunit MdtA n=1 Tax=Novipirellula aureliae TaxID=2527966 RepID=A0A5C6DAH3_9BACT|nr:efflux RND transporter periplasmic adaptor subunit [Novipirellula aureliae]TWU34153.1 multidrug efflux system subunit MdtA [Novipirellula aureliae]
MANSPIDLSRLALDRSPPSESAALNPRRKRWFSRYMLPLCIFLGFVALLGAAAGRQLLPSTRVTVVPVMVKRAELQPTGTTLFQAPGWIEPRPTAISVAALAPGVIEELSVVEGQQVEKGEAIARLISIDAEMDVERARNTLAIRDAEVNRARAELDAAKIRVENPVHLHVQLADAQSALAKTQTELAKLPFLVAAAEANAEYAHDSMEGKRLARGAISGRVIARSESEHATADAELHELRSRRPNLQREVDALTDKVNAVRQQLKLLVEETRQFEAAKAELQSAEGMREEAKLRLRQAELVLQRNVVRAPISGRVLRRIASPGTRVMGLDPTAGQSSSTVIEMYDPNRLQVRADVRLEDVPMVMRGQTVEIETASTPGVIQGRVLRMTSTANIQKNTLEVKVELIDPPENVRPEMLVTASFLAPIIGESGGESTATERKFIPDQLVQTGESGTFVWIVDENNAAQRRTVDVGSRSDGGLVEIISGLNLTDKLVVAGVEQLKQGSLVVVTGDDQTFGINQWH